MAKARESPVQTQRVWMKSAIIERELVRRPFPDCRHIWTVSAFKGEVRAGLVLAPGCQALL